MELVAIGRWGCGWAVEDRPALRPPFGAVASRHYAMSSIVRRTSQLSGHDLLGCSPPEIEVSPGPDGCNKKLC